MEKYPKLIEQRFWKTQDDESAYLPHFGDFNLGGKKDFCHYYSAGRKAMVAHFYVSWYTMHTGLDGG